MTVRAFRPDDAKALAGLSAHASRHEVDFVLNPMWETEEELFAEYRRHGIDPEEHILVAEEEQDGVVGLAGFLRRPGSSVAGLLCPIIDRDARRRGIGGEILRATLEKGADELGLKLVVAGIGTRNRAGYSLLTAHGFRPVRQHFLMLADEKPAEPVPGEGLVFEEAGPDDAGAILAVYHECGFEERSLDTMQEVLRDGRHRHVVAREDGRVVAFVEMETHWPTRVWVAFVGVARSHRDRGNGSSLAAWALRYHFEHGATSGLLLLSPANRTGMRAYEKVGFRRYRVIDVLERRL